MPVTKLELIGFKLNIRNYIRKVMCSTLLDSERVLPITIYSSTGLSSIDLKRLLLGGAASGSS